MKWLKTKQKKKLSTFSYPGFTFMAKIRNTERWNLNVFAMKMFWNFIRISSSSLFGPFLIQFRQWQPYSDLLLTFKELFSIVMPFKPSIFMLLRIHLLKSNNFKALQKNLHLSESTCSVLMHLQFSDINLWENFTICHKLKL